MVMAGDVGSRAMVNGGAVMAGDGHGARRWCEAPIGGGGDGGVVRQAAVAVEGSDDRWSSDDRWIMVDR